MTLFEGERVRLTALEREDLPTYLRWHAYYPMRRLLSTAAITPATREEGEAWYEESVKPQQSHTHNFSIRVLDDGRLIGGIHLNVLHPKHDTGWLSIYLGERDTWGRGYGSDATRLLLGFAFDELNLHRVELSVFDFNARAIRAYEKVGFRHEATRRAALYREGAFHDVHVMGILRHEWDALASSTRLQTTE